MTRSTSNKFIWFAVAILACGGFTCVTLRSRAPSASVPIASAPPPANAATTNPTSAPGGAVLTITIKDLRNHNGDLIFGVFSQADGFPNVQAKSLYWEVKPATGDSVSFTTRLPPGRYAAGVLHDENRSGDLDKGIGGIPLEGYGVTNNPKPRFRKATFDEAAFTLPAQGAALTISLLYF
jgi:uncharacterized protein (DUF2141 family)